MQIPRMEHVEASKHVLRYLKGIVGQGILLKVDSALKLVQYVTPIGEYVLCLTNRSHATLLCLPALPSPRKVSNKL